MSLIRLKKGGEARYVFDSVAQNDSFTIPRGTKVSGVYVESRIALSSPTITVGATPGILPIQTFTVTGGATSSTNITVDTITVAVVNLDTPATIAGKIAATDLSSKNWSVKAVGAVVTLTGLAPKNAVSAVTVSAGTSGATFSAVTATVAGVLDSTFMAVQNLGTTAASMVDLTSNIQTGKAFVPRTGGNSSAFTFAVSSATAGTVTFAGKTVTLTAGQVDTAPHLATALAAIVYPEYTVTANSNVVTVLTKTPGIGTLAPTIVLGTATGITWSTAFTPEDVTYYINTSANAVANANVYVMLQKFS